MSDGEGEAPEGGLVDRIFGNAFDMGSDDEGGKPAGKSPASAGRVPRRDRDDPPDDDDDDDDDDDEIRPSPSSRRRSRGRSDGGAGSSSRRRMDNIHDDELEDDRDERGKKRKRGEEVYDDGGEDEGPPPEDEKPEKPVSAMDRALARNKAKRRQRKKDLDPVEIDEEVIAFLGRMMRAREEDIELYSNGKPAMNKLRMLPEVRKMFVRHEFRESLLDNMMLAVLKCWLEPVGDTALPNIEIRGTLLEILLSFRVDSTWAERLENSQGLGKIVNYLSVTDDHPPNKRMAVKLIKSWTRIFYNSNSDFHDLHEDYEQSSGIVETRRDAKRNLDILNAQNQKRLDLLQRQVKSDATKEAVQVTARLPEKSAFLFTKMAASDGDRVTRNRNAKKQTFGGTRSIAKRFNSLRKGRGGRRSSGRAENPSINGRD